MSSRHSKLISRARLHRLQYSCVTDDTQRVRAFYDYYVRRIGREIIHYYCARNIISRVVIHGYNASRGYQVPTRCCYANPLVSGPIFFALVPATLRIGRAILTNIIPAEHVLSLLLASPQTLSHMATFASTRTHKRNFDIFKEEGLDYTS